MASKKLKEFTFEEVAKVGLANRAEVDMLTTLPVNSITRRATWYALEHLARIPGANEYRLSGL